MNTDTKGILTIAYPEIEKQFKNPNTVIKYKKLIGEFITQRNDILYSSVPSKPLYYSLEDMDKWFKETGVDRNVIKEGIKNR